MIKVGIHENVRWNKATKNDRGTLVAGIIKESGDALAALDSTSDSSAASAEENDFLFFPPKATNKDNQPDTAENNMTKIKEFKDQLNHILQNYMTSDKIKWDTLKGTGVTSENMETRLTKQETLDIMYNNVVDQFIVMISPFLTNPNLKYRILLTRSSKAKHYPALRKRYLGEQPFMEPMTVPKAASALKYTKWELDNGFNNPDRVELTVADQPDANAADLARQAFGQ